MANLQKQLETGGAVASRDQVIVDKTTATDIAQFGELGLQAASEINEAQMELDIIKHARQFDEHEELLDRKDAAVDQASQLAEQTAGLVEPNEDPAFMEVVDNMKTLAARMQGTGYQGRSREQRRAELNIRMHAAMKKAMNRLPGYADAIRQTASSLMRDQNYTLDQLEIATGIDPDSQKWKLEQEEKRRASVRSQGTKMHMVQSATEGWYEFEARVLDEAQNRGLVDAMKNQDEAQQRAFLGNEKARAAFFGYPVTVMGNIRQTLDQELAEGRITETDVPTRVDELILQQLGTFDAEFAGVADSSEANTVRERIEGLRDNLTKFYSGEQTQIDLERSINLKKGLMEKDLLDTEEGKWMWFLDQLVPELRRDFYLTAGGVQVMSKLAQRGKLIAEGGTPGTDTEVSQTLFKVTNQGLDTLLSQDPEVIQANTMVLAKELESTLRAPAGKEKLGAMTEFAKLASRPEFATLLENDLTGTIGPMAQAMMDEFSSAMYGTESVGLGDRGGVIGKLFDPHWMEMTNVGGNVGIRAKPGVQLSPRASRDLTTLQKDHIPRINTLIRAQATMAGMDYKDLASDHAATMNQWGLTPGATPPSFGDVLLERMGTSYQRQLERTQATVGPEGIAGLGGTNIIDLTPEGENGRPFRESQR